jgi:hypothetical protein
LASARAALISGQSAQIWPAFVSGFFARRCARRFRVSGIQLSPNSPPHIPREWERGFGTRDGQKSFVEATIGGRSQQGATDRDRSRQLQVGATIRDSSRHIATKGSNREGHRQPKNPVVEHKGIVEHGELFFALKSFDLSAFMLGDTLLRLFDACSTA